MPMDEMKYGCLFVQSGYEERAIRYIERYLTDYEATGLEKIQYRSREGVRTQERNRLMPGYVFFRTVTELEDLLSHGYRAGRKRTATGNRIRAAAVL